MLRANCISVVQAWHAIWIDEEEKETVKHKQWLPSMVYAFTQKPLAQMNNATMRLCV